MLNINVYHPGQDAKVVGSEGSLKLFPNAADFTQVLQEEMKRPARGRVLVMGELATLDEVLC